MKRTFIRKVKLSGREEKGEKSRWGVLTALSWTACCELQLQLGSPNSFLRSPFRQSVWKLYVSPGLKFKPLQKEVQQPWLRVRRKWMEGCSPHSQVERLSKFLGWIWEGTTSVSVFFFGIVSYRVGAVCSKERWCYISFAACLSGTNP